MASVEPHDESLDLSLREESKGQQNVKLDVPQKEEGHELRQYSPRFEHAIYEEGYDGGQMFADPEKMKEGIRAALLRPPYNVANFYHKTGIWQHLARNAVFENVTLAVISVNALWMMIDTDNNEAATLLEADPIFQIVEHLFCLYFSFEWFVRFMAFKKKRDGLQDAWFVFDSLLVFMMVLETWVMTIVILTTGGGSSGGMGNTGILRLFRLLRLSRMARMLRSMPELMILIKGMVAAARSVFFTLVLLLAILYIFAIAFTQLCDDTEVGEAYFNSILSSMYTLLIVGTFFDNLGDVLSDLGRRSAGGNLLLGALFTLFIALAALMVMNMLIGILCEVVSAVAATEKEHMRVDFVKSKMEKVIKSLDSDGTGFISKAEFMLIMQNKEAVVALEDVDVDPIGLVDMADFIFEEDTPVANYGDDGGEAEDSDLEKQLSFSQFMEIVLSLRGNNTATVKDVVDFRKFLGISLKQFEDRLLKKTGTIYASFFGGDASSMLGSGTASSHVAAARADRVSTPSQRVGSRTSNTASSSVCSIQCPTGPEPFKRVQTWSASMMDKASSEPSEHLSSMAPSVGFSKITPSGGVDFPSKSELNKGLGRVEGFLKAGLFELQQMGHLNRETCKSLMENTTKSTMGDISTGATWDDKLEQQAISASREVSSHMAAVEEFLLFAMEELQQARRYLPPLSKRITRDSTFNGNTDVSDIRLWMTRLESFIITTGLGELHSRKSKMWRSPKGTEAMEESEEHGAWLRKAEEHLTSSITGLRKIRQGLVCELS